MNEKELALAIQAAAFGEGPKNYNDIEFSEGQLQYVRDTVELSLTSSRADPMDRPTAYDMDDLQFQACWDAAGHYMSSLNDGEE